MVIQRKVKEYVQQSGMETKPIGHECAMLRIHATWILSQQPVMADMVDWQLAGLASCPLPTHGFSPFSPPFAKGLQAQPPKLRPIRRLIFKWFQGQWSSLDHLEIVFEQFQGRSEWLKTVPKWFQGCSESLEDWF